MEHTDARPRIERTIPRMLDASLAPEARDQHHEVAPYVPPPEKTGLEQIAERAIIPIRQTGQRVLDQFKPMHERLDRAEQMVITAMADAEANIYAQVGVIDAAAKIIQQVDHQLAEAMKPLAALANGK